MFQVETAVNTQIEQVGGSSPSDTPDTPLVAHLESEVEYLRDQLDKQTQRLAAATKQTQTIEVKSKDGQNISKISTAITNLIGEGVRLQASMPRYYYTQVNDLKSELLIAATKDAQMRARTLAEGSGVKLGPLRAARQGVFSIRRADASDISEKSYDDVSSISKKVSALVTVDYAMR